MELLSSAAHGHGFPRGDSKELLHHLRVMAVADETSLASLLPDPSTSMAALLETTGSAVAKNPEVARVILRKVKRAELPAALRTVAPPETLEPSEPAVRQLMASAEQVIKTSSNALVDGEERTEHHSVTRAMRVACSRIVRDQNHSHEGLCRRQESDHQ